MHHIQNRYPAQVNEIDNKKRGPRPLAAAPHVGSKKWACAGDMFCIYCISLLFPLYFPKDSPSISQGGLRALT